MEGLYYNPNPRQRYHSDGTPVKSDHCGDCTVRAITKALDITWEEAYKKLCEEGLKQHKMPNDIDVYGKVLEDNGFNKGKISRDYVLTHHHRPTVEELSQRLKYKKIIVKATHHLTTVDEGVIYDTWDTSNETVWSFWYK